MGTASTVERIQKPPVKPSPRRVQITVLLGRNRHRNKGARYQGRRILSRSEYRLHVGKVWNSSRNPPEPKQVHVSIVEPRALMTVIMPEALSQDNHISCAPQATRRHQTSRSRHRGPWGREKGVKFFQLPPKTDTRTPAK